MAKRITLQELVELAGQQARRVILEAKQPLMPSWVLVGPKGQMTILGTPWKDDLEKEMTRYAMRRVIKEKGIVSYSVVTEAWTAVKPNGWTPEKDPDYLRPKDDPERKECVIALATDGKAREFRRWLIKRNHLEQVTDLELVPGLDDGPVLGWMLDLL